MRYFEAVDLGFIKLAKGLQPSLKYYTSNLLRALIEANTWYENGKRRYGALEIKKDSGCSLNRREEILLKGLKSIKEEVDNFASGIDARCYDYISNLAENEICDAVDLRIKTVDHLTLENSRICDHSKQLSSFIEILIGDKKVEDAMGTGQLLEGVPIGATVSNLATAEVEASSHAAVQDQRGSTCNKYGRKNIQGRHRAVLGVKSPKIRKAIYKALMRSKNAGLKLPDLNKALEDTSEDMVDESMINDMDVAGGLLALRGGASNVAYVPVIYQSGFNFAYPEGAFGVKEYSYHNLLDCGWEEQERLWMVHNKPTEIKLRGVDFYQMLNLNGDMTCAGFDLFTRLVCQEDSKMHELLDRSRLRHVMHLCWASGVLSGLKVHENEHIRLLFTGSHIPYDVFRAKFIMVPYMDACRFHCVYVLDMIEHIVTVYDPLMTKQSKDKISKKHSGKCKALIEELHACANAFYRGWSFDTNDWPYYFHTGQKGKLTREEGTFHVLNFILTFKGDGFQDMLDKDGITVFKMKLLQWFGRMDGNMVKFPSTIIPHSYHIHDMCGFYGF